MVYHPAREININVIKFKGDDLRLRKAENPELTSLTWTLCCSPRFLVASGYASGTKHYLMWIVLGHTDIESWDVRSELKKVVLVYGVVVLWVLHLIAPLFLTLDGRNYVKWEYLHHKLLTIKSQSHFGLVTLLTLHCIWKAMPLRPTYGNICASSSGVYNLQRNTGQLLSFIFMQNIYTYSALKHKNNTWFRISISDLGISRCRDRMAAKDVGSSGEITAMLEICAVRGP